MTETDQEASPESSTPAQDSDVSSEKRSIHYRSWLARLLIRMFQKDGAKAVLKRPWGIITVLLAALGVAADLSSLQGAVPQIAFVIALISTLVFSVIVFFRLRGCQICTVPLVVSLTGCAVFGIVAAAQAATGTEDKGLIFATLQRIDETTQATQRTAARTEQKVDDLTVSHEEMAQRVDDGFRQLQEQNLLQYANLLNAITEEKGVSKTAMIAHLLKLGARPDIEPAEIPQFLERFADEYLSIRERLLTLDVDDDQLAQIRRQAADALEDGDPDAARRILREAREIIRRGRETGAEKEALLISDEAGIDMLDLEYRRAAVGYLEASKLTAFDQDQSASYLVEAARALYALGDEFGDNDALLEAIETYRLALEERTRARVPLDWAATQNNLGAALRTLGSRESGTARLEDAVAAYRLALEEITRARVPLDWAATQNNLGAALSDLGERESGTARLEDAVAAYRLALEERTRARVPLDWAKTQNNLGAALRTLGSRESGTTRLEDAVAAYRLALEEITRARVPLDWAATQNNLGAALSDLGERESGTARLEDAVAAYRLALEEWTRARVPLDWFWSQYYFSRTLGQLAERLADSDDPQAGQVYRNAAAAVAALRPEALKEIRPDIATPLIAELGNRECWYRALAIERTEDVRDFEQAVAACERALSIYVTDRTSGDWAMTAHSDAYLHLVTGEVLGQRPLVEKAVELFQEALADPNTENFSSLVEELERDLVRARAYLDQ